MAAPALSPEIVDAFSDREWRLDNLYWVQDEYGNVVKFRLRPPQRKLLQDLHYLNLVLKARQIGFSTLILLIALDCCIWNDHFAAGLIADTKKNAENLLVRIKFAYDSLPDEIQRLVPLLTSNSTDMAFANGSTIEVGVSLRSSTKNLLHISEYGKICAQQPNKAKEIKSGSLNTLAPRQLAFIESTAEGKGGDFYDKVQQGRKIQESGRIEADLEWRFHFFPWWLDPKYASGQPITLSADEVKYFEELEAEGVKLTAAQEFWYAAKSREQGDEMFREFPSTAEEAFSGASEGAIFGKQMRGLRKLGKIGRYPFIPGIPVNTFWDFGVNDMQTIWLHQEVAGENNFIGYYENNNVGLAHYFTWLDKWAAPRSAVWGKHHGPHDVDQRRQGLKVTTIKQIAADVGFMFKKVDRNPSEYAQIENARRRLASCNFDESACAKGVLHLENYTWEWDENNSVWSNEPRHNEASHGAKGFMTFTDGYRQTAKEVAAAAPPPQPVSFWSR